MNFCHKYIFESQCNQGGGIDILPPWFNCTTMSLSYFELSISVPNISGCTEFNWGLVHRDLCNCIHILMEFDIVS